MNDQLKKEICTLIATFTREGKRDEVNQLMMEYHLLQEMSYQDFVKQYPASLFLKYRQQEIKQYIDPYYLLKYKVLEVKQASDHHYYGVIRFNWQDEQHDVEFHLLGYDLIITEESKAPGWNYHKYQIIQDIKKTAC